MSRRSGLSYFAVEGGSINTACTRDALLLRSDSKSCVCATWLGACVWESERDGDCTVGGLLAAVPIPCPSARKNWSGDVELPTKLVQADTLFVQCHQFRSKRPGHEVRLACAASCEAHLKGVTYVLVQDSLGISCSTFAESAHSSP